MQLKKIEIQGFKSFADKTEITFLDGVTTIVGPNGSGKSNVSDAIRWVLGEQSIKTLRGSKMEDIIFAGTQNRKRVGFAQVSMYLDNSDNSLPVEYSEVVVSRRLYRSGESSYLINNLECRLKDVLELFMDTGIGKDGYSMIGQGKIDEILSNKSEERRAIFEEASGIVKYRTRKDEATRKLDNTNLNLTRVNDVLKEIELNIDSLLEKSNTAKKYLNLKEELKHLEILDFIKSVEENSSKILELDEIISTFENDETLENKKMVEFENKKIKLKEDFENILSDIEATQTRYYESENEFDKLNYRINLSNEKLNSNVQSIETLKSEIEEIKVKINENIAEMNKRMEKKDSLAKNKLRFETELNEKEDQHKILTKNMSEKEKEKENLKLEISNIQEKKHELGLKVSSFQATILSSKKQIEQMEELNNDSIYKKDSLQAQKVDFQKNISQINANILKDETNFKEVQEQLTLKLEKSKETEQEKNSVNQELMTLKSKYNYLKNLENENEGYFKSVKSVLDYVKKNNISNVYGTLANIINTEEKFEYAIEIAMGGYLQNIVVETQQDAKNLIEYLKNNLLGRATFLPITNIKANEKLSAKTFEKYEGFLGVATDVLTYSKKFESVISLALNKTIIVDNIENAIKISKAVKNSVKIVTLSGELIATTGSMTGGKTNSKSTGLIGRNEKIANLQNNIDTLEIKYKDLQEKLKTMESDILVKKDLQEQIKEKLSGYRLEFATLDEKLKNLEHQISQIEDNKSLNLENITKFKTENEILEEQILKIDLETSKMDEDIKYKEDIVLEYARFNKDKEDEINFLNEDILNLKISLSSFDESVLAIEEMKSVIEQDIKNQEELIVKKEEQIVEYNQDILNTKEFLENSKLEVKKLEEFKEEFLQISNNLKIKKQECMEARDIVDLEIIRCTGRVNKIREEKAKVENKKVKFDVELENLKNNIWDEYELTISSAKEYISKLNEEVILNIENKAKKIEKLKLEIKSLGNVDIDSIEEYTKTKERFEFINSQKLDLEETKIKLENLISNMTTIMRQQFASNFNEIKQNFNNTFKELFGGGKAELRLSDENNILESGIDIEVQPPGKKLQSMMLLSGGERALTAIALLFAIIKIKSPPFCILDEIEAALDDVNVQRFADYIKKYSDITQFIVITHRKGTMEVASAVYGITMEEYGISKVISMKMS